MVWLSKPLGASGAVLEDIAQPSNTKPRNKRAAENIVAFFIRSSSANREYPQRMSYHTGPPQQEAGSTFTTSVRGRKQKGRLRAGSLCGVSLLCSSVFCLAFSSACNYFGLITPNVPARLL